MTRSRYKQRQITRSRPAYLVSLPSSRVSSSFKMIAHVGLLPAAVLDSLVTKLNGDDEPRKLRFMRLPHPRSGVPSLFLPYQAEGKSRIAEVQVVSPPNERSWFMSEDQVVQNGRLLTITPVDPAFLLLPILQALVQPDGSTGSFRPVDDILEDAVEKLVKAPPVPANPKDPSTQLCKDDLTHFTSLSCTKTAMRRVCETKDITPELTVFQYSPEKVNEYFKTKVLRLNSPALFESSKTLIRSLARDGLMEDGNETLLEQGRLKTACDLVAQYVPESMHQALLASYDFTALDAHLKTLQDEAAASAAADMRKMEIKESKTAAAAKATDKKRKNTSQGVEKLKKANTKGMANISSFFKPKAP